MSVTALRVDRRNPAFGSRSFYILQWIVALSFQNHVPWRVAPEPDDEVRHVIVHLPIVEIRNGESQSCILNKGMDGTVLVDVISSRLLPLLCVGYNIIHVASQDFDW